MIFTKSTISPPTRSLSNIGGVFYFPTKRFFLPILMKLL